MKQQLQIVKTQAADELDYDLPDMFADLPPLDPLDLKKDEIAANFAALMSFVGITRTQLADKLNCKKSRITQVLSGRANPTLSTLWELSSCLGYDFDIVFRSFEEKRYFQPWQNAAAKPTPIPLAVHPHQTTTTELVFEITTAPDIARDLAAGTHKPLYISLCERTRNISAHSKTIEVTRLRELPSFSFNILQTSTEEREHVCKAKNS